MPPRDLIDVSSDMIIILCLIHVIYLFFRALRERRYSFKKMELPKLLSIQEERREYRASIL